MATATVASPWSDANITSPYLDMAKTRSRLNPHTPLPSSARKISGKRKRNCDNAIPVFGEHTTPASMAGSPSPLVNERYDLEHGAQTPSAFEGAPTTPDLEGYRSTWLPSAVSRTHHPALGREGNGRSRASGPAPAGRRVWTVGGMVGKVASFCASMLPPAPALPAEGGGGRGGEGCATPRIPGMFPVEASERPRKRMHREDEDDWIVIAGPAEGVGSPTSRASTRRTSSAVAGTPRGRKSLATHASQASPAGSPRRRVSVAGLRARRSQPVLRRRISGLGLREDGAGGMEESEDGEERLTLEVKRMVKRRERDEREADKRVGKMGRTIQELIRQGQVALESSFEIEEGSDEE